MNKSTKRIILIGVIVALLLAVVIGVCLLTSNEPPASPSGGSTRETGDSTGGSSSSSSSVSTRGVDTADSSSSSGSSSVSTSGSTSGSTTSSSNPASGSGVASQSGHTISGGTKPTTTSSSTVLTSGGTSSTVSTTSASQSGSTTTKKSTASTKTTRTDTTSATTTTSRPTTVTLPTAQDPETGETGIQFPCAVPGYDLVIEKLAPYQGMFVEDGSNVQVDEVAMLLLHNEGDQPLEFAQIVVEYEGESLLFEVSALPAGERAVVQEKTGKPVPDTAPKSSGALVVHRASLEMSSEQVSVRDNGNNTLTITNLTDQPISTVRVFYKYYMEDQDLFVGGIAFSMRLTRLGAGASVTVQPSHYTSETGRVVMVLTYEH